MSLQIAYPDLVVDTASSTPAFPASAFISDLGGQLGLFAGISVITIAELLEYPFVKLYSIFFTKNRKLRRKTRKSSTTSTGGGIHSNGISTTKYSRSSADLETNPVFDKKTDGVADSMRRFSVFSLNYTEPDPSKPVTPRRSTAFLW